MVYVLEEYDQATTFPFDKVTKPTRTTIKLDDEHSSARKSTDRET